VWEKTSGFHDLNERIPPGSGWKLEAATGINNRGEIVGWGDYKGNEQSGFLLVPQP
jgi:probable HAF family extracellular repeat protein